MLLLFEKLAIRVLLNRFYCLFVSLAWNEFKKISRQLNILLIFLWKLEISWILFFPFCFFSYIGQSICLITKSYCFKLVFSINYWDSYFLVVKDLQRAQGLNCFELLIISSLMLSLRLSWYNYEWIAFLCIFIEIRYFFFISLWGTFKFLICFMLRPKFKKFNFYWLWVCSGLFFLITFLILSTKCLLKSEHLVDYIVLQYFVR